MTLVDIALDIKDRCFGGADTYTLDEIEDAVSDAIRALSLNIDTIDDAATTEIQRHVWVGLTGTEWPWP